MPSFIRNLSGGKAISGGALAPRSRRGNTGQVDSYWSGGGGPNFPTTLEYLVVAGGAGGGQEENDSGGGGGGGGGFRTNVVGANSGGGCGAEAAFVVAKGTAYTVTIGAAVSVNTSGNSTTFSTVTSIGGGRGGLGGGRSADSGGSGGGGGSNGSGAGSGTACQGSSGAGQGGNQAGGGGGAGSTWLSGNDRNGRDGQTTSITGTSQYMSAGGGGGCKPGYVCGSNGTGSGNYGSGGAGRRSGGGGGVQGIVVLRYPDSFDAAVATTGSPSVTLTGGYRIYTFTASGSITF